MAEINHHLHKSETIEEVELMKPGQYAQESEPKSVVALDNSTEDVEQRVPASAMIVTLLCGLNWIAHLYTLTIFAAFARNIALALEAPTKAIWVFNAASVVTVVAAPTFSYFSDIYGRRQFMLWPFLFGIIGGVVGYKAHNINQVIAASALIGIAASLFGIVTAIPSEVLPHKYRSYGQGVVFIMSAFACLPSLLGIGRAIQNDPVNGWRYIFLSEIVSYGVQPILWFFAYHPPKRINKLTISRPKLDFIGYFLLAAAVVPFLMALSWGGVVYPWKSAKVLSTLIIGLVLWVAFGVWEWKGRSDGILHHDLWKDRNFTWSVVGLTVEGWTYLTFSAIYPAHTATVYESDIFKSGLRALPFYAAFIPMLGVGAWYVHHSRNMILPATIGYAIFTAAIIGFVFATPSMGKFFLGMDALAGFGFSQPLVLLTIVGQFAVPPALIGTATALLLTIRGLGGAVGQAVANTIVQGKLTKEIPARIAGAVLPLGLDPSLLGPFIGGLASGEPAKIEALLQLPGVTPQILEAGITGLKAAFGEAYKYAWISLVPVSVLGTLSCLFLKGQKDKFNNIIDAPLAVKEDNKA